MAVLKPLNKKKQNVIKSYIELPIYRLKNINKNNKSRARRFLQEQEFQLIMARPKKHLKTLFSFQTFASSGMLVAYNFRKRWIESYIRCNKLRVGTTAGSLVPYNLWFSRVTNNFRLSRVSNDLRFRRERYNLGFSRVTNNFRFSRVSEILGLGRECNNFRFGRVSNIFRFGLVNFLFSVSCAKCVCQRSFQFSSEVDASISVFVRSKLAELTQLS